ncbi:hypothetical protein [Natrinema altunense]|uniref:Peptidase n=1 Tax=Natrinema altunense TaxID=222984 RepID=A0A482XTP0_9EURY|nr:hypothetical protein [Natrinema altunense]RZH66581.1 hypothetical protein ELS17_16095 [Natrinema altunense]
MKRREFLSSACLAAGTAVVPATGSADAGEGGLTVEIIRHESVSSTDDAMSAIVEGASLFADTWTDATEGTATVTTDEGSVADFGISASHTATLDAIENAGLRSGRTPETITVFVIGDGRTSAGAMRSYAGHDGGRDGEPGAYGYVNTEIVAGLGFGIGTPEDLRRNFAAHECGHAVIGWADFPHYPADATADDPSPVVRAHSCGAQDHPDASGWLTHHGITVMATGYSARESSNTPRNHQFATQQGAVGDTADPVDDSWSVLNMDYVAAFSDTSRAVMSEHYRQFLA